MAIKDGEVTLSSDRTFSITGVLEGVAGKQKKKPPALAPAAEPRIFPNPNGMDSIKAANTVKAIRKLFISQGALTGEATRSLSSGPWNAEAQRILELKSKGKLGRVTLTPRGME